jgi:hypothetical protein
MDILTDILRQAGLRRRLLDRTVLAPMTPARFPCDRSMGLHIVLSGQVRLQGDTLASPLSLEAGDVAWMARGCLHELVAPAAHRPSRAPRCSAPPTSSGTRRCTRSSPTCRPSA